MFSPSTIPTDLPTGLAKPITDALTRYRQACELYIKADLVEGLGDRDLAAARAADDQLIVEALAQGKDIERVGRPNEAAFIAKRDAYRTARNITGQQAAETSVEVAALLGDHSDQIVNAFAAQAQKAADTYRTAAATLAAARAELERTSNRLQWATALDGSRVPSIADESHPRQLSIRAGSYTTERLLEVLEVDANSLAESALTERTKRRVEAQQLAASELRNAIRIGQISAASMARRAARTTRAAG